MHELGAGTPPRVLVLSDMQRCSSQGEAQMTAILATFSDLKIIRTRKVERAKR